jgi:WD40 repeat protein/serine/threonine protein kinase
MKNLVGTTLQHYQILVKVRETGTRILFKAYAPRLRQYVGLEVIKIHCADQPALLTLLREQADKNARLDHPNIARLIDSGIEAGMIFLVYDFHPLRPLRRFFNRTYTWQETARELVAVTQAVGYAHEAGICHGALNPSSILLNDKRSPVLFDFGFEHIIKAFTLAHSPGVWINKWGYEYLSPEQLNGEPPSPPSDIYAMGMILHEWMYGAIVFLEPSPLDTLRTRLTPPSRKHQRSKEIPAPIHELIEKCLAPDPSERYQSMQEVGLILARGALDLSVNRSIVRQPLKAASSRRNDRLRMALAVMAVAVLAVGTVWGVGSGFPSRERSEGSETAAPFTVTPSHTPAPTSTPASVSVSTVESSPTAASLPLQTPAVGLPLFQGMPLPFLANVLTPNNIKQIVPIGIWGMGNLNDLVASPDGRYLAAGTTRGVFLFEPQTLTFLRLLETNSQVNAVAFSADGKWIAVGDNDGLVRLWNTLSWEMEGTARSAHRGAVLDLAFSPEGNRLASVGTDGVLQQWTLHTPNAPPPLQVKVQGVSSVVYSAEGKQIVSGDSLFKINIWNAADLTLLRSVTLSSKVMDLAALQEASLIVAGGADRRIVLVDTAGEAGIQTVGGLQYPLAGIAATRDGSLFAGADVTGGISVWNREGKLLWQVQGSNARSNPSPQNAHSLSFSPDGKTLYSGLSGGALRSFDAASGSENHSNRSFDVHVSRLIVSHASRHLLTQHGENTVGLWEIRTGKLLYQTPGKIQNGNPFSANDQYVAIAVDSATVQVLRTAKKEVVYTFNGHQNIETLQFLAGDRLLAAGNDRSMHLWSMTSGQELKIKRNYSGSGCANYFDLQDSPLFSITTSFQHIVEDKKRLPFLCNFTRVNWMRAFYVDETTGSLAYGGNSQLFVKTPTDSELAMEGVNLHNVVSVALHPGGELLAAAYDDHTIHIWNTKTHQEIMTLFGHNDFITDLRFSPDGKILFSASQDGTIRLWGIPD